MPVYRMRLQSSVWKPFRYGTPPGPNIPAGRDALQVMVHKPGPENTGPYTVTSWTERFPSSGNSITLSTPGTYYGIRFWGIVKASVPGVILRECWLAGPDPTSWSSGGGTGQTSLGCLQNYGSDPKVIEVWDSIIDPSPWVTVRGQAKLNPYNIGIHGGQVIIKRSEITNVSDGINFIGPNGSLAIANAGASVIEQNWIHKGLYANDLYPPSDGQPHCDGFQMNYGKNVSLRGNTIGGLRDSYGYNIWPGGYNSGDDFWNAALMLKNEAFSVSSGDPRYADRFEIGRVENVNVEGNWLSGGTCTLNLASDTFVNNLWPTLTVKNNRFQTRGADWGKTMRGYSPGDGGVAYNTGAGYYILRPSNFQAVFTGNVNEQTGTAVPISNG